MSVQENDLQRLIRVGEESSRTNQKLIGAVQRTLEGVLGAIPSQWKNQGNIKVGDYLISVCRLNGALCLVVRINGANAHFVPAEIRLCEAQLFARIVVRGFVSRLCEEIEAYHDENTRLLESVETGESRLKALKN